MRGCRRLALLLLVVFAPINVNGNSHKVECESTAGDFSIVLNEAWSPKGVARFLELVDANFFDGQLLYRVIPGFLVQFGVAANPKDQRRWDSKRISDEPKQVGFKHGTVSFAGAGLNSRDCHIFIAFEPDGVNLGTAPRETPIGEIQEGIQVLDRIQQKYKDSGYGDLSELQRALATAGNDAAKKYPKLDSIKTCRRFGHAAKPVKQEEKQAPYVEHPFKVKIDVANLEGEKGKTGSFVVEIYPEWAPLGAARFHEIITANVWDKTRFHRVIKEFVAQFGIPGKPGTALDWRDKMIMDDPPVMPGKPIRLNERGTVVFAKSEKPDSRAVQVFINLDKNKNLDGMLGYVPVGKVVEGMETVVDKIYYGYGEEPNQDEVHHSGNTYLKKKFPRLSYIQSATFVEGKDEL